MKNFSIKDNNSRYSYSLIGSMGHSNCGRFDYGNEHFMFDKSDIKGDVARYILAAYLITIPGFNTCKFLTMSRHSILHDTFKKMIVSNQLKQLEHECIGAHAVNKDIDIIFLRVSTVLLHGGLKPRIKKEICKLIFNNIKSYNFIYDGNIIDNTTIIDKIGMKCSNFREIMEKGKWQHL